MADRFPLIFNTNADQIQELAASDNLDLASSNLTNVANVDVAGLSTFTGACLLYTSPSPRDGLLSRMPSSA